MDRDELHGDMNDLILGSQKEQMAARQRILSAFSRLTEEIEKYKQRWIRTEESLEQQVFNLVSVEQVLRRIKEEDVQPDISSESS